MQNTGIELELRHNKTINEFNYGVGVLFHRYRNKVTKVLAETLGTIEVGQPYNNFFMYEWAGIFQSQDEINTSPTVSYTHLDVYKRQSQWFAWARRF